MGFSAGEKRESSRGQRERAGKRSRLESRVNSAFARVNRHSRAFLLFSLGRSAARKRARGHEKCKGERAQIISSSVENVSREFFFFSAYPLENASSVFFLLVVTVYAVSLHLNLRPSLLEKERKKRWEIVILTQFDVHSRSKSEYIGARNRYKLNSPTFRPTYFSSLLGETRFLEDTRSESIRILRFSTPTRSFRGSLADRLTPERALEICWPSLHYRLARTSIRSAKYPQVTMGDTSNVITVDEFRVTGRVGLSGRI